MRSATFLLIGTVLGASAVLFALALRLWLNEHRTPPLDGAPAVLLLGGLGVLVGAALVLLDARVRRLEREARSGRPGPGSAGRAEPGAAADGGS